MRLKLFAVLAVASLVACQQPLPTAPTNVNVFNANTQNQGSNQNSQTPQQQQSCAGLVQSLSAAVTGGTFSGGKGHVGEPVLFSISTSPELPSACSVTPRVIPSGACVEAPGFSQTLEHAAVLPNALGLCVIAVQVDGKSTSFTVDVV